MTTKRTSNGNCNRNSNRNSNSNSNSNSRSLRDDNQKDKHCNCKYNRSE